MPAYPYYRNPTAALSTSIIRLASTRQTQHARLLYSEEGSVNNIDTSMMLKKKIVRMEAYLLRQALSLLWQQMSLSVNVNQE